MFPRVISLKLDRGLLGAGMTLSRIAGAFVAQLSTRAANQAQVLCDYSTGKITRVEAMTQLGVDCRELLRIMVDSTTAATAMTAAVRNAACMPATMPEVSATKA